MITAQIPYTIDTGEKLVNETFGPNNIRRRRSGGAQDMRPMPIEDGRAIKDELQLERNGFVFVEHKTAMKDFFDEAELKSVYYREVEDLIKKTSGAKRVVLFDHTLRSGNEGEREEKLIREPVLSAHNDYTEWSGPQRVRDLMGDEAEDLLKRRFAIIQVWRAINQPIQSNPLAIADAGSVAPEDLMVAERRYPNRVGQTYRLKYNPNHRWFYFPKMRRDEAIVFKVYDSEKDGRARFTAHSSFNDPTTPPGAPPRQSIEARALLSSVNRPHAIVTGGSSGIGLAIARRLLADGMSLTLIARRNEVLQQARDSLLSGAPEPKPDVLTIAADVSVREQAESAIFRAIDVLGAPRLLVTSAGMAKPGYFDEVAVDVFERTMAVNYLGTVYVVKAAVPHMRRSGGHVVMISSGAGLIGMFGYTPYSPTKFALRGFAEALHAELRHQGIAVSIAFPPDTDTPQLIEEGLTKPAETVMMTKRAGLWSAQAVADRIIRGMARRDFAITPGLELTVLYRFGSLLAPLIQHGWARQVARMRRTAAELATNRE